MKLTRKSFRIFMEKQTDKQLADFIFKFRESLGLDNSGTSKAEFKAWAEDDRKGLIKMTLDLARDFDMYD